MASTDPAAAIKSPRYRQPALSRPRPPVRTVILIHDCVYISYLIISQYLAFRQQTTQPFAQSEASLLSRVIRGHGTECRILAVQKPQLDIYNGSSMAGEFWIQLFGSCVQEQEPPPRYSHSDNTAQILRKSNSPEHKTFKRKASERMLMMLEVDIY